MDASRVAQLAAPYRDLGATEILWIDGDEAAALRCEAPLSSLRDVMTPGVDAIAREEDFRPALLLADMDSTMIGQECIDELAAEAGVGERVAAITERAMRGELDFAGALRERLGLLEGLDAAVIGHLLATRIRPNRGAATMIATLRARGCRCVLVSGGFTAFADVIGERLGFDRVVSNRLGIEDGRLTGTVEGPIVDAERKRAVLAEERGSIGNCAAIAIGDGANDLPMLGEADLGIAFHAKPKVAAAAHARIDHGDLRSVLWGAGIRRKDWVEA